jgi:hypothetical protein
MSSIVVQCMYREADVYMNAIASSNLIKSKQAEESTKAVVNQSAGEM